MISFASRSGGVVNARGGASAGSAGALGGNGEGMGDVGSDFLRTLDDTSVLCCTSATSAIV